MSPPKITWADGSIAFDSVSAEDAAESAQVTTSPVESGFAVSDGVIPAAPGLKVSLLISDRPLDGVSAMVGRAANARKQLGALMFGGTLINYYSDSETFENACIGTLSYSRTGRPGEYELHLSFVKVVTTETQWVAVDSASSKKSARKTAPNKDKATGAKTDASPSAAASLVDWWNR